MRAPGLITVSLGLLVAGTLLLSDGAWIRVKAQLAQVLLHHAWERARGGAVRPHPWPWADTWPVARLEVPSLGVDEVVLAGASGRTLAFGPGHVDGTAPPGAAGVCVLSGHRDTHFAFLEELKDGTEVDVETADGRVVRYRVTATEVVDQDDSWVLDQDGGGDLLTLVTCWPFHAVAPGGPGRYVVWAEEVGGGRREGREGKELRVKGKEPRPPSAGDEVMRPPARPGWRSVAAAAAAGVSDSGRDSGQQTAAAAPAPVHGPGPGRGHGAGHHPPTQPQN